ncbi:MAG: M20/M25/M40 family metallo-hydrolase [Acidobacteriota bacterium]|nr:M20/M25/M40 family metallo-hydrolase [Acidobacteriota bacterium]
MKSINPAVARVVENISEERIASTMKRLEGFGTRNTFSETDHPTHGIGAARNWIAEQFRSYSPLLEVRFDRNAIKKSGRIWRDVEVVNIVAVLKGKVNPDRTVIVSGHYDSLNRITKPKPAGADANTPAEEDHEATVKAVAPGVNDDGSGTAAVLELARVMSQYEWNNTVIFIAFDAEEYGLVGSHAYAERAKKDKQQIEAVLNNDIIGSEATGSGRISNRVLSVFSADPADSPSRQLARYVRDIGERYVPGMQVNTIFRPDRFGRGGDHSSFEAAGFAAVRFTTPEEDYGKQHKATDTFASASPDYTARVTRVNGAVLASLALAPAAPVVTRIATSGLAKGRSSPTLSRGVSGYDAQLRWSLPKDKAGPDLAGFAIVIRATTAPFWERELYVGNVNEYIFKDFPIDDCVIGVKAIDSLGNESLVSAYVVPSRFQFGSPATADAQAQPE